MVMTGYRHTDTAVSIERRDGKCTARVLVTEEHRYSGHQVKLIPPPTESGTRFHQVLAEVMVARVRGGENIDCIRYELVLQSLCNIKSQVCRKCGTKTMTYCSHAGQGTVLARLGGAKQVPDEGNDGEFTLSWNTLDYRNTAESLVDAPKTTLDMTDTGMRNPYVLGVFDPFESAVGSTNYRIILSSGRLRFKDEAVETAVQSDLQTLPKETIGGCDIRSYRIPFVEAYIEHGGEGIRILVDVLDNPRHKAI